MTETKLKVTGLAGRKGVFVHCKRVSYGKKDTECSLREYRSGNSAVGNEEDWITLANAMKYDGVVFEDTIQNEKIVIDFNEKVRIHLNHVAREVRTKKLSI